jgi:hypothetical protein
MNPWDHLSSIWDGWTHQTFGMLIDERGTCAIGFFRSGPPVTTGIERRFQAVDGYLRAHFSYGVIGANDQLRWTPEQFRDLDRRLEFEYRQQQKGIVMNAYPAELCSV